MKSTWWLHKTLFHTMSTYIFTFHLQHISGQYWLENGSCHTGLQCQEKTQGKVLVIWMITNHWTPSFMCPNPMETQHEWLSKLLIEIINIETPCNLSVYVHIQWKQYREKLFSLKCEWWITCQWPGKIRMHDNSAMIPSQQHVTIETTSVSHYSSTVTLLDQQMNHFTVYNYL